MKIQQSLRWFGAVSLAFAGIGLSAFNSTPSEASVGAADLPAAGSSTGISSLSSSSSTSSTTAPPAWKERMRKMAASLESLLIAASQEGEFAPPSERPAILKTLEVLREESREMGKGWGAPDADPSIRWLAKSFELEVEGATSALKSGGGAYARSLVRSLPVYCVACHSRGPWGAAFSEGTLPESLQKLSFEEQGNYWAATRHFDRALQNYERAALEPTAGLMRERPLRAALALSLRLHQDPSRAIALLDRFEKATPPEQKLEFLHEQVKSWREALVQWREDRTVFPAKTPENPESAFREVKELLARAKKQQAFPSDRRGEVWLLLATARAHAALASGMSGKWAAELLRATGDAYGGLRGLWSPPALYEFQGYYYLGCILQVPHTPLARHCFQSYEEGVRAGYTGSAGTAIPSDVTAHFETLRVLAAPKPKKKVL